jgi:hypothetical protein
LENSDRDQTVARDDDRAARVGLAALLKFDAITRVLAPYRPPLEPSDIVGLASEGAGTITLFPGGPVTGARIGDAQWVMLGLLQNYMRPVMEWAGYPEGDTDTCWRYYGQWLRETVDLHDQRGEVIRQVRLAVHQVAWTWGTDRSSLAAARRKVERMEGCDEYASDGDFLIDLLAASSLKERRTPFFVGKDGLVRIGDKQARAHLRAHFKAQKPEEFPPEVRADEPESVVERVQRAETRRRVRRALEARLAQARPGSGRYLVLKNYLGENLKQAELARQTGKSEATLSEALKKELEALRPMLG